MEKLNILYASDKRGVNLMLISAYSVMKHVDSDIDCYIMCSPLPKEETERINKILSRKNVTVNYVNVNPEIFKEYYCTKGLPVETLFRLTIGDMLPVEADRVLYIDIDVLCVSSDIKNLYQTNFDGCGIIAVNDAGIGDSYTKSLIGDNVNGYFNAGVLLIDLDYWRKNNLFEKIDTLMKMNAYKAADQDCLNIIFKDKWKAVSTRFNYMSPQVFKDMMFYHRKGVIKGFNPVLIHYDGPHKPWFSICANPYKDLYYECERELDVYAQRRRYVNFSMIYQYIKYRFLSL